MWWVWFNNYNNERGAENGEKSRGAMKGGKCEYALPASLGRWGE